MTDGDTAGNHSERVQEAAALLDSATDFKDAAYESGDASLLERAIEALANSKIDSRAASPILTWRRFSRLGATTEQERFGISILQSLSDLVPSIRSFAELDPEDRLRLLFDA